VELIEHQELQVLSRRRQLLLHRPREDQFHHHVVGDEDVRWVRHDGKSGLIRLLAGVASEGDGALAVGVAEVDVLVELADLTVRKRVHRVDDDRLDPLAGAAAQDAVDDRDDVREALS